MTGIILLAVHLTICIAILVMIKTGKIKTRHIVFPAVVFLPLCGICLLVVDEWQKRHAGRQLRDVEDYGVVIEDEVWHREVAAQNDDELTVPLEEAMTINSPVISRKLMMKLLHTNPEQYVELLKKVTLSDDVELTHYATTSMMEIQSRYEEKIGKLLEDIKENPDDSEALIRCKNQLRAYIDSGLISDTVLMQYRVRLGEVLKKLCDMQPDAVRYEFEYIENCILIGNTENIKEKLDKLEKKYPDDVRVYRLYVQYYYCINDGKGILEIVKKIKKQKIYLDNAGKQWLEAWSQGC